jgi:hypothetical protein
MARRRGWGMVLAVLVAVGGLAVAGRVVDLPRARPAPPRPTPATAPDQAVTVVTVRKPTSRPGCGGRCACPTPAATAPARPRRWWGRG